MKLCKQCRSELKDSRSLFCSDWCKEQSRLFIKRKTKIKVPRKCECGHDLKKGQHKCDDCKASHKFEYVTCEQKCLNCGGPITARNYQKDKKRFCEPKCIKAYYFRLHKNMQCDKI